MKQTLDGETIYTIYGVDGSLYYRDNITTGEATDYIRIGSHTVGRMDETGASTWGDHLGSASASAPLHLPLRAPHPLACRFSRHGV